MARSHSACEFCGRNTDEGKHGSPNVPVTARRLCQVRGCGEESAFVCDHLDGTKSVVCPNRHPPQKI